MQVIRCGLHHVHKLCELTEEFAKETKWGFTFDYDVCSLAFFDHISSDKCVVLAVERDGDLLAAAILIATQDFCADTQGFLHKFYVRKPYRRTKAMFLLMDEVIKWFDSQECVQSFVTSTSGIDEAVICAFAKLMRKYGYRDCGPTLARGLHG